MAPRVAITRPSHGRSLQIPRGEQLEHEPCPLGCVAYDKTLVTPGKSNNVVYLGYWDSTYNENASLRGEAQKVIQQRFGNIPYTGTFWGPPIPTTSHGRF